MGRVKLVLRLVEDQPEQTLLIACLRAARKQAQRLKGMAVVIEQLVAVFLDEARPTVLLWHRALLVVWRLRPPWMAEGRATQEQLPSAFVGHLEEQ